MSDFKKIKFKRKALLKSNRMVEADEIVEINAFDANNYIKSGKAVEAKDKATPAKATVIKEQKAKVTTKEEKSTKKTK